MTDHKHRYKFLQSFVMLHNLHYMFTCNLKNCPDSIWVIKAFDFWGGALYARSETD